MYALVDCNNFYVSCERLFQPRLIGKPVVVLSNNDGCVIARSEEAKSIGIAMGSPAYMLSDFFRKHKVAVYSSNYTLYGDMSHRVMSTLASFVPRIELYSIDEAFLDMSGMTYIDLFRLGLEIRRTIIDHIGIPVTVGIAPTRALAKMANRYAKKAGGQGVFYAANQQLTDEMLTSTSIQNIWGIGSQHALRLRNQGVLNAKQFTDLPAAWIRKEMSVVGLRLWNELHGIPSTESMYESAAKKNICTSRSLGKLSNDPEILKEAVSNHAATSAQKLRQQASVCQKIQVFIGTNPHKIQHSQYHHTITLHCNTPTNSTGEIIAYALKGLEMIFKPDVYLYMKCGVILLDIIPENSIQCNLFDQKARHNEKKLLHSMDAINQLMGKDTVRMAVQRFDKRYKLRADHLSRRYTTRIDEILNIRI